MLAGRLPLPVPNPVFLGHKSAGFPWPFMGYAMLKGRTAARVSLSSDQRAASAPVLGRFLRALHAFPASKARRLGAESDQLKRVDIAHRIEMTTPRLRKLARLGLIKNEGRLLEMLHETRSAPASSVLLHGDHHAGQLLVDTRGKVCAVIDWGDLHVGHPAVDLSIAHTFLPARAHEAFRRAYGSISEPSWLLARFRGIGVMAALAEYAHRHGDRTMLRTGLTGLRLIETRKPL
jgi:aminoglycoside phosphotransferase (APT) family kinase protein